MKQPVNFKSLDKSVRKQKIIDTAVTIFQQKGYRSATLDDVAQELGLTKAALYHYVSSKEGLLTLIYLQALESFFAKAYEIGEMELSPPEKLRFLIRHHIQNIIIENLAMFAVFFTEENQLPEKDFQEIRREKRKYTQVFEKVLEEGVAQGYFVETDIKLQAFSIIGMCNWLYKWYKPGVGAFTPEKITDHFIGLLEDGYLRTEAFNSVKAVNKKTRTIGRLKEKSEEMAALINELDQLA